MKPPQRSEIVRDNRPDLRPARTLRPRDLVWHDALGVGIVVAWDPPPEFGGGLTAVISVDLSAVLESVAAAAEGRAPRLDSPGRQQDQPDIAYAVALPLRHEAATFSARADGVLPRLVEPLPWWTRIGEGIRNEAQGIDPHSAARLPGRWHDVGPRLYAIVAAMDDLGLRALLDDLSDLAWDYTRARDAMLRWVSMDSLVVAADMALDVLRRSRSRLHPIEELVVEAAQADVEEAVDERLNRELGILADRIRSGLARATTPKGHARLAGQLAVRLERLADIFGTLRPDRIADAEARTAAALNPPSLPPEA